MQKLRGFFLSSAAFHGKASAGEECVKAVAEMDQKVLTLIPHPTLPLHCLG